MKSFLSFIAENSMFGPLAVSAALAAGTPPAPDEQPQQPVQQTQKTKKPAWHGLVSGSEGLRTKAYWDETGKVWTIGKGSTTHPDGRPVKQGDVITSEQADQYMEHYVNKTLVPKLQKIPTWEKMNENQRGALISFGYNVGPNFYGSKNFGTLSKALSSEEGLSGVPDALKMYNKSGGKVLRGLQTRREAEGNLWNTPVN